MRQALYPSPLPFLEAAKGISFAAQNPEYLPHFIPNLRLVKHIHPDFLLHQPPVGAFGRESTFVEQYRIGLRAILFKEAEAHRVTERGRY